MIAKLKFSNRSFVQNIEASSILENFLVAAVISLLMTRAYLKLQDYPVIGLGNIHIAHVLFGGVALTMALLFMFIFLNNKIRNFAALLGGFGFGMFIDELGKFITKDNDYFYRPTVVLIYFSFIMLFLISRYLQNQIKPTHEDYVINSLELLKEVAIDSFDEEDKQRIKSYLEKCDQSDHVVQAINNLLLVIEAKPKPKPGFIEKVNLIIKSHVKMALDFRFSLLILAVIFSAFAVSSLYDATRDLTLNRSFTNYGQLIGSILFTVYTSAGLYFMTRRNGVTLEMFKRASQVSIFLTQFFTFYKDQFKSLIGLSISLVLLVAVQYLINKSLRSNEFLPVEPRN